MCLCAAQEISPTVIAGQAGENVTIMCTSFYPGEAVNTVLMIYIPKQDSFERAFESSPQATGRLLRSDSGSVSTFVFGPLMSSDNGTIFRCRSAQRNSANTTISVTCKSSIDASAYNIIIIIVYLTLFSSLFSPSLSLFFFKFNNL